MSARSERFAWTDDQIEFEDDDEEFDNGSGSTDESDDDEEKSVKYSAEQERDDHGRWTATGGGAETGTLTGGVDPPEVDAATAEKRLVDLYERSVANGTVEEDKAWYQRQHDVIGTLAEKGGVKPEVLTAMVAATSPQTAWDFPKSGRLPNLENAQKAMIFARDFPDRDAHELAQSLEHPGMLRNNLEAAIRIYRGEDPNDVLTGPKVRSFYNNLLLPDQAGDVTIDTHMAEIVLDRRDPAYGGTDVARLVESRHPRGAEDTIGGYGWVADRIRAAAETVGVKPHELQAATWVQWRRDVPDV